MMIKILTCFKVYPTGFPVTSLVHAVIEDKGKVTLCGVKIKDEDQWYFEDSDEDYECKRCIQIIKGIS